MIPTYQFASLQMENDAKKRVMKRAIKGQETEEQRVNKSGRIADSIKNVYNTIISNLEMQKSTIVVAETYIKSVAYSVVVYENPPSLFDDSTIGTNEDFSTEQTEDAEDVRKERSLNSFIFASLGKLVNLSYELVSLVNTLGEEVLATGRPASASIGISKIVSLMGDVDKQYGNWGVSGLAKSISVMATALLERGQYPPQLDGLLELWEQNNESSRDKLEKIQSNQYVAELKSVNIPSKSTDIRRKADIASGVENRDYSRSEYELMLKLRQQGYLQDDDFTSVYSGDFDDNSTIASYSDDDGDSYTSGSNASFRVAPSLASSARSSRSGFSNLPPLEFNEFHFVGGPDSDDETLSGNGLYSLPTTQGRPLRYY